MIRIAVAFVLGLSPISAHAQESGNTLLYDCSQLEGSFGRSFCAGYVTAIADTLMANDINGFRACFPEGVTNGQIRDVVTTFLRRNPELRHYGAAGLVSEALENAFPC